MPTKNTPRSAIDDAVDEQVVPTDVIPKWNTLPEDEIEGQMGILVAWLKERGAKVSGPKVKTVSLADESAEETADSTSGEEAEAADVYEAVMSWSYKESQPITIVHASADKLEALRRTASEAYLRRFEV